MARQKTAFQIPNRMDRLKDLQHHLETFSRHLNLSARTIFELNFIIEEVVANIILHGYTDTARHFIDIQMSCENQVITLTVIDDGKAFDPVKAPAPDIRGPLHERKIGGLGIYLLKKLAGDITYERQGGKNRLILKKKVQCPKNPVKPGKN